MRTRHSWKRELQDIINCNNHRHAVKPKNVSFKTRHERATFLFGFFTELRRNDERNYKVQPSGLRTRHVQFMLSRWIRRGLSPGTIQLNLSYLRVFAGWIGKEGMIRPASEYVEDAALVRRSYGAKSDRSWSAQGLDARDVLGRIADVDSFVGAQLAMCLAFGMRVKEAIMFQPFLSCEADQVRLLRGTKGGRERCIAVDNDGKRAALELARRVAVSERASLGDPRRSLKQNHTRFYTLLKRFGITKRERGVTAHGLRHAYANNTYEQFAGVASPVRDGPPVDRDVDRAARLRVANELGHARENITTAYLGPILRSRALDVGRPIEVDVPQPGKTREAE